MFFGIKLFDSCTKTRQSKKNTHTYNFADPFVFSIKIKPNIKWNLYFSEIPRNEREWDRMPFVW